MRPVQVATWLRRLSSAATRRAALIGLASGLLASVPPVLGGEETEAKKKKRKNKGRRNRARLSPPQTPPPAPPAPVTRGDAICFAPYDFGPFGPGGEVRFAQTFTALAGGPLVRADLFIVKEAGTSGDYILQLAPVDGAGTPTGIVLASASVSNDDVDDGQSVVTFTFATPYSVVANTQYALVLGRPESASLVWGGNDGDACPGQAFYRSAPEEAFIPNGPVDHIFRTFVRS